MTGGTPQSAVAVVAWMSSILTCARAEYTAGDFAPGPPDEFITSDGGFESAWGADTGTQTLVDANLGAFLLVMEPGSLRTPHYADVPVILAVLEGAARGGIINDKGEDTSVRRFVRGDIVALPAGWVMWILNNDTQQRFSMLGGARTDHLPHPAKWETFNLVGGEVSDNHGLLHAFSKGILAESFNVEEELIDDIHKSEADSGLLKLSAEDLLALHVDLDLREKRGPHEGEGLIYNIDRKEPDYKTEYGQLTRLDSDTFPILKNLGMASSRRP